MKEYQLIGRAIIFGYPPLREAAHIIDASLQHQSVKIDRTYTDHARRRQSGWLKLDQLDDWWHFV